MACHRVEPPGGRGVFQEEGRMAMTILVIIRVCRKSGGGGEGGQPTQKQGEGVPIQESDLGGGSQGSCATSVRRKEFFASGARWGLVFTFFLFFFLLIV